jgi:phosphoglycerate dehydrogenase-like enzyme
MKIVIADRNLARLCAELEAGLPASTQVLWPDPADTAALEAAVSDADVLVSSLCPAELGADGKRLRLVHAAGAGTDGEALRDNRIGGAAIDVWYRYPAEGAIGAPADLPFHELPNVLMTPHSSGLTRQTFTCRAADIAANIRRLAAGQPLSNVVAR